MLVPCPEYLFLKVEILYDTLACDLGSMLLCWYTFNILLWFYSYGQNTKQSCDKVVFFFVTGPCARTLRTSYLKTAYLDKDGKVKEEFGQVWGTLRSHSGEFVLVLKVVLKVKDDQNSDDQNPRYVYVRKSDLLSIEPVKWENHMALDPCLVGMNINDSYMKICHHRPCFAKM